jgi:hypothetical protein
MGQKDIDLILGRIISDGDEGFGKEFCERLGKIGETGDDKFLIWLTTNLKINLSRKELQFLKNKGNLCEKLKEIRNEFKIKYEYDGIDDPKRN